MADSFFDFDTSLSNVNERDDAGGRDASEDEYDALNDETFGGDGEDGDWEQQHEALSMLTENDKNHSDLEAFLSHLVLEEYEEYSPETISPIPPLSQPAPPSHLQQHSAASAPPPLNTNIAQVPPQTSWLKNALSVEELERNLLRQPQKQPNQQQSMNQQQQQQFQQQAPPLPQMNQLNQQQHMQQLNQQQQQTLLLPPQLQQQHMQHQKQIQQLQQQQMQQQMQQQHPPMHSLMPFFQNRFPSGLIPPGPPPMMGPRPPFMTGPPPPIHPFGNFNQMPPNKMPIGILQRPPHTVTNLQALEKQQQQTNMHHQPHHPVNNLQQPINNLQQPMNNLQQPMNNLQQPMNNLQQPMNNLQQPMNNLQQPMNNLQQSLNNIQQQMQSGSKVNQPNNMQQQIGNINQNQQINSLNQPLNKINQPNMNHQQLPNSVNQNQNVQHILQQNHQMNQNNNRLLNQPNMFKNQNSNQNSNQKKPNGPRIYGNEERAFSQEEVMQLIQETHPLLSKCNILKTGFRRQRPDDVGSNNIQGVQRRGDGDQYSGLMSQREKQWLLNIQLMQLNTGTPYIDDYYYTVFLDRQSKKEKQQETKEAHKANQQNHPFSQQNLNNRFGNNSNSGEGGRERRNSSRSTGDGNAAKQEGPRTYVPTQFENSLGKLQCGSVTAPRKIIDMEVVSAESAGPETSGSSSTNSVATTTSSRGSRQTLLAIESLYRLLLRVEDLSQPLAIANALVLREREEKQKALLLEQQQNALDDEASSSSPPNSDSANHFLRGIESVVTKQQQQQQQNTKEVINTPTSASTSLSMSAPNLLDENKTDLLGKLMSALLYEDRLSHMLLFRKGKTLLVRILAQAIPVEWWRAPLGRLWPRLLRCLPICCRRDSQSLMPLVQHARSYLWGTEGWAPVSDLCQVLAEGLQQGGLQTPIRAPTPGPQHHPRLMGFMLSTQLGLSLLVILFDRATAVGRPVPAAWTALVRASAKQALQAPTATAMPVRPVNPLLRASLATHAASAGLSAQEEESLSELLC